MLGKILLYEAGKTALTKAAELGINKLKPNVSKAEFNRRLNSAIIEMTSKGANALDIYTKYKL